MSRHESTTLFLAAVLCGVAACGEGGGPSGTLTAAAGSAETAVKFWDTNAAANWNERATSLAARRTVNVSRLYAYLSLAQLRAAEDAEAIKPHSPTGAAIGAASAVVLKSYFPLDATEIDGALATQAGAAPWPGAKMEDFDAGAALGRAAAARVIAYSASDLIGLTDPGHPPTTPGHWLWTGGPIARGNLGARPFFLASRSEFLPLPPPTFESAEYLAAVAEVRQISDTRTASQLAIAQYWNTAQSPASNAAMNGLAVELIRGYRVRELESARILFLMNAASFDALIGCFEAKYTYWYIRPPQYDALITLPIGLPPHPSYPSAHSCVSGSSTAVLAAVFPTETDRLAQVAEEASLSRLYGGIHYRFDMVAGLALGRAVAGKAMGAALDGVGVQ